MSAANPYDREELSDVISRIDPVRGGDHETYMEACREAAEYAYNIYPYHFARSDEDYKLTLIRLALQKRNEIMAKSA